MSRERWQVEVSPPARRDIDRLPDKAVPAMYEALQAIAGNPRRVGKQLQLELEGQWAARRGPYRLIYEIDDERRLVKILRVGHRADVYRPR